MADLPDLRAELFAIIPGYLNFDFVVVGINSTTTMEMQRQTKIWCI
jgi:hypothetical protein